MVQDLTFNTKVSGHTKKGMVLRGQSLEKLVEEADFVSTLFLSITGRKPKAGEKKVLNAILVASIDHGINPASGFVPRVVAASGNDVLTAMASTLLALGPYHGGAITGAMEVLAELGSKTGDLETHAENLVKEYRQHKKRIPGYGHPSYKTSDPRTVQLFEIARKEGLDPTYPNLAEILAEAIERVVNKKLILNVDGAIAALLLAMGFEAKVGNAIFAFARVGGSIAHIQEEQTSGQWVRRLSEETVKYEEE